MLDQIISLTKQLISIPSTKDNPKEIEKALEVALGKLKGFTIERFKSSGSPSVLVYKGKTRPKKFKIILNGHLDVVPGKPDQYNVKITGDKLSGRGTLDMKVSVVVMILVFKELADKLNYSLGLQLVTDEEIGGLNGTKYQIKKGVKADFVIAGEYSDLRVSNEAKGPLWVKITTKGKAAHGAQLWKGANAIQKMVVLINKINKTFPIPNKESWVTTQNLAKIETNNETVNKVPDNCVAWFDFRYIPQEKDSIISKIKKLIPDDAIFEISKKEPCQFTQANNSYIKKLRKATKAVTGKDYGLISFNGASDIRHYGEFGFPGVCFGPVGKGLHSDTEWISVKSVQKYYSILKKFLLSL